MITFTNPHAAAIIREHLAITPTNARILTDDNTTVTYCDYTGQQADVEIRVYGTDHYDSRWATFADLATAITELTDAADLDTIEVVVSHAWATDLITTPTIQAAA